MNNPELVWALDKLTHMQPDERLKLMATVYEQLSGMSFKQAVYDTVYRDSSHILFNMSNHWELMMVCSSHIRYRAIDNKPYARSDPAVLCRALKIKSLEE